MVTQVTESIGAQRFQRQKRLNVGRAQFKHVAQVVQVRGVVDGACENIVRYSKPLGIVPT